jgi:polar amino acid transport system substrate-binding protein
MLNRAVFSYLLGFILWALNPHVSFANSTKLTIYTEHFPPYNFIQNTHLTGINITLVKLMCNYAEIDCEFELLPWNRAYQMTLTSADSGLVSTARNLERAPFFIWVGPLAYSKTYLYKLKSRTDIQANTMFEAARYSVSIQRNDVYADVLTKYGFNLKQNVWESSYKNQELELFFAGKIDLLIGSDITLPYQLKATGKSTDIMEQVVEVPTEKLQGNFLALNKHTQPQIVQALQKAYLQLLAENKIAEVIQQFSPQ